jgi:hypothetical protein
LSFESLSQLKAQQQQKFCSFGGEDEEESALNAHKQPFASEKQTRVHGVDAHSSKHCFGLSWTKSYNSRLGAAQMHQALSKGPCAFVSLQGLLNSSLLQLKLTGWQPFHQVQCTCTTTRGL